MVTRKRTKKVRDSEATKRRLIDAVGAIVRDYGFHELGVNKIAAFAERDKGLIKYHFKSLNNLLRAYIAETDYWPPFFERYKIDGSLDQKDVKDIFTALMTENLGLFYNNVEMQKIILWQISEKSPLLRAISEAREVEGGKLLHLADPTFLNSGISFQAIICLLLGGSYYAVLHAHTNKSSVCTIDINWNHDFKVLEKTISQIISWAWEKAHHENKLSIEPMNYELEALENLVEDIVETKSSSIEDMAAISSMNASLVLEIKKLERVLSHQLLAFTNETQIITFLQVYMAKLVKLCNRLYEENPESDQALMILDLIESIRRPVAQYLPETVVLPILFREKQAGKFSIAWSFIEKPLSAAGVDQKLIDIIHIPINRFVKSKEEMRWCDFKYLKRYVTVLGELVSEEFTLELLFDYLIGLGYNYSRFSSYYVNRLKGMLSNDPLSAKTTLSSHRTKLQQITIFTQRPFDNHKMPLLDELIKWIDAENLLQISDGHNIGSMKLLTKFKAVQFAFWNKLQYDHGVYEEDNLDVFSEKIAYNFSTKGQEDLSAPSIKSKFYPKEKPILQAVEKLLTSMLEDVRRFL